MGTRKILAILVLALGLVNSASADIDWDGGGDCFSWYDGLNWENDTVPGQTDDVRFNPPPCCCPIIDPACSVVAYNIHGPRYNSNINQCMLVTGGSVKVWHDWKWCRDGSGTGTIDISGSSYVDIYERFVGVEEGTGILVISDNSTLVIGEDWEMAEHTGATGIIRITDNATVVVGSDVDLAEGGLCRMYVSDNATVQIADDFTVARDGSGVFEYYQTGGSTVDVADTFLIGRDGSGIIDVSGGTVDCGALMLETRTAASTGTLNVSGTSAIDVTNNLAVGTGAGTATMNMSSGTVAAGTLSVAGDYLGTGGTGTLNMTGGSITIDGQLAMPATGLGKATINLDGGTLECGSYNTAAGPDWQVNITAGVWVISGNLCGQIQTDVQSCKISGYLDPGAVYPVKGKVCCDFGTVNLGKTTVMAIPCGELGGLPGDVNYDCAVNWTDIAILASSWLNSIVCPSPFVDCPK